MVVAEIHSNLGHSGVVILWMVNGCNGLNLMAYRRPGQSVRRHTGWAGVMSAMTRMVPPHIGHSAISSRARPVQRLC